MTAVLFRACPVCDNPNLAETGMMVPGGPVLRCGRCTHLMAGCPEDLFANANDKWDSSEGTMPDKRSERRHVARISRILKGAAGALAAEPAALRLLDVGCSSGSVLKVARDLGFAVKGVEPAAQAAAAACSSGFDVFPGVLQDAHYEDGQFDLVTLFEVIEHLRNPKELLLEIRRILRPGGLLVLSTGNVDSWTRACQKERWQFFDIYKLGGHVSFFSLASMRHIARETGFDVVRIATKNVRIREREQTSLVVFRLLRLLDELLNQPSRWMNRGHDMLVTLRVPTRAASGKAN